MDNDDGDRIKPFSKERYDRLGYKPQKENLFHFYLPYMTEEEVDNESESLLNDILTNLGNSVARRDFTSASLIYSNHLIRYIDLFGYKFSKDVHIKLVKLMLELVKIPDLGYTALLKYIEVLKTLLRKKELLSPGDLQIEWRQMYELAKLVIYKSSRTSILYRYQSKKNEKTSMVQNLMKFLSAARGNSFQSSILNTPNTKNSSENIVHELKTVLHMCKIYYSKSSVRELRDEILPKTSPLDTGKHINSFEILHLFLNPYEGWDLWLFDFIELWNTYQNPKWGEDLFKIIANVSVKNVGLIDWEPYLPIMFTRFLRAMDLPVGYKGKKTLNRNQSIYGSWIGAWIVGTMKPGSSTLKYLANFLNTIESYIHPANMGYWIGNIEKVLMSVVKNFMDRIKDERYRKPSWIREIPESHKLDDDYITEFVTILQPIMTQAMYSVVNTDSICRIMKILAELRPQLIIPEIIKRVYLNLETMTERLKFALASQYLISVSSILVTNHNGFIENKMDVIPILQAFLPAIDPNDWAKTSSALIVYKSLSALIPFIDSSTAGTKRNDLTEEEGIICGQTAEFEDFVIQLFQKFFQIIEYSSVEATRMEQSTTDTNTSMNELHTAILIKITALSVLTQCSDTISVNVTRKVIEFIRTHIFEPKVAAPMAEQLVGVCATIPGHKEIYRILTPFVVENIERCITERQDHKQDEKFSDEFLYYLHILHGLSAGDPYHLCEYVDEFFPVLDYVLRERYIPAIKIAAQIISSCLGNLSILNLSDVRSNPKCFEDPIENLPIRNWGCYWDPKDKIEIKLPTEVCYEKCKAIVYRYLLPRMKQFESFIKGDTVLSKEERLRDVLTMMHTLNCAFIVDNDMLRYDLVEDEMIKPGFQLNHGICYTLTLPDGRNIRTALIELLEKLQDKILSDFEDDTKTLCVIAELWRNLTIRMVETSFAIEVGTINNTKKLTTMQLVKHKRNIRIVQIGKILDCYVNRMAVNKPLFTEGTRLSMLSLLKLATSNYVAVRARAQEHLQLLLAKFEFSYNVLIDEIVKYLQLDPTDHYKKFKGVLYILTSGDGRNGVGIITRSRWEIIERMWLTILQTHRSDKPSIIRLFDIMAEHILNGVNTMTIALNVSDDSVQKGLEIVPPERRINEGEILNGLMALKERNELNRVTYYRLCNGINEIVLNKSLHWRYRLIANFMIYTLCHPIEKYPLEIIQYTVHGLIHESIQERKWALRILLSIIKQNKRIHPKITVDPYKVAGINRPGMIKFNPGIRDDNLFLQYEASLLPKNQLDWDAPIYNHKTDGYFGWSPDYKVYAPTAQQPPINLNRSEMSDAEQILFDFFTDSEHIKKLTEFWSLEEKKGSDKFRRTRFTLIKYLVGTFGEVIVNKFLEVLPDLIKANKNESNHRCASEIYGGILKGMKHWPYENTERVYQTLIPITKLILSHITVETDSYWGICFATATQNFDPRRQYWLYETLLEDPYQGISSFMDCTRIMCIQGPLRQHAWRLSSISHRLVDYYKPLMNHRFQNIRQRIGVLFGNIYEMDNIFVQSAFKSKPIYPLLVDLMEHIVSNIQILKGEMPIILPIANEKGEPGNDVERMDIDNLWDDESDYNQALRLFKTALEWMMGNLAMGKNCNRPEYFDLLPFLCKLERNEHDKDLARSCMVILQLQSQAFTYPECIDDALKKISEVASMSYWSVRLSVLDVLQVLVFYNMSIVLSRPEWIEKVQSIVLTLLEDSNLEVREKAAEVLCGLLHCSFLPTTDKLLALFKTKCNTKVVRAASRRMLGGCSDLAQLNEGQEIESIRIRHTGVLGLCAFISAYPYDIPDFIPEIFERLGAHLNDPQPISTTIRKTVGNFKRTHHENWEVHQQKFTEDQLAVLSDLTAPTYYA